MNQEERLDYLINYLINENKEYGEELSSSYTNKKDLLRALFNVRDPKEASEEFIKIQDEYLKEEIRSKGITCLSDIEEIDKDIYLWKGDITTLECDAIVNAANNYLQGCFQPNHNCIDNAIHTFSGIQLRNECAELMRAQGHLEETGKAKITPAYNLPSKYVIHTVGPIVYLRLTKKEKELLKSCYSQCLKVAENNGLNSIAFCCISTGVFGYPQEEAAKVAIDTVKEYKEINKSDIKVIFNVFKEEDERIYRWLLNGYKRIKD